MDDGLLMPLTPPVNPYFGWENDCVIITARLQKFRVIQMTEWQQHVESPESKSLKWTTLFTKQAPLLCL